MCLAHEYHLVLQIVLIKSSVIKHIHFKKCGWFKTKHNTLPCFQSCLRAYHEFDGLILEGVFIPWKFHVSSRRISRGGHHSLRQHEPKRLQVFFQSPSIVHPPSPSPDSLHPILWPLLEKNYHSVIFNFSWSQDFRGRWQSERALLAADLVPQQGKTTAPLIGMNIPCFARCTLLIFPFPEWLFFLNCLVPSALSPNRIQVNNLSGFKCSRPEYAISPQKINLGTARYVKSVILRQGGTQSDILCGYFFAW